jgi:hypothetical protein
MKLPFLLLCFISFFAANAQFTGATPWENCYGKNASCKYVGCSDIKINTSSSSAIVAIVKKNGNVVKHAYIAPSSNYTFELLDGIYQVFFYYGSVWDSNKVMKSSNCSSIRGGFKTQESVSKGDPITLKGNIMEYTLTRSTLGNFSPKSSNLDEAL